MASRLWGGLCSCRSEMWRDDMVHHGLDPLRASPVPGCPVQAVSYSRETSFL